MINVCYNAFNIGFGVLEIDMADCKDFQKMIDSFEKGKLTVRDEEIFIAHIEDCPDCKEEFEIHYIIEYGLGDAADTNDVEEEERRLIENFDFGGLVDYRINESLRRIDRAKTYTAGMKATLLFGDFLLFMILCVYFMSIFNM